MNNTNILKKNWIATLDQIEKEKGIIEEPISSSAEMDDIESELLTFNMPKEANEIIRKVRSFIIRLDKNDTGDIIKGISFEAKYRKSKGDIVYHGIKHPFTHVRIYDDGNNIHVRVPKHIMRGKSEKYAKMRKEISKELTKAIMPYLYSRGYDISKLQVKGNKEAVAQFNVYKNQYIGKIDEVIKDQETIKTIIATSNPTLAYVTAKKLERDAMIESSAINTNTMVHKVVNVIKNTYKELGIKEAGIKGRIVRYPVWKIGDGKERGAISILSKLTNYPALEIHDRINSIINGKGNIQNKLEDMFKKAVAIGTKKNQIEMDSDEINTILAGGLEPKQEEQEMEV